MTFYLMVSHDRKRERVHQDHCVVLCLVWHSATGPLFFFNGRVMRTEGYSSVSGTQSRTGIYFISLLITIISTPLLSVESVF